MPIRNRPTEVQQHIHGDEARVAGGHYFELGGVAHSQGLLEIAPTEQLDDLAVDNERLFARRFGRELTRDARASVIAIKQQRGFIDSEVRWLLRSGFLRPTRMDASLRPTLWAPAIGWFMAIALSVFCATSLLQILISAAPAWKQALGAAAVLALGLGLNTFVARLFLMPWRLLRDQSA